MSIPISNGTEWEIFSERYCEGCMHDHDWSHNSDPEFPEGAKQCDIILRALMGGDCPEIVPDGYGAKCTSFVRCDCEFTKDWSRDGER